MLLFLETNAWSIAGKSTHVTTFKRELIILYLIIFDLIVSTATLLSIGPLWDLRCLPLVSSSYHETTHIMCARNLNYFSSLEVSNTPIIRVSHRVIFMGEGYEDMFINMVGKDPDLFHFTFDCYQRLYFKYLFLNRRPSLRYTFRLYNVGRIFSIGCSVVRIQEFLSCNLEGYTNVLTFRYPK